MRLSAKVSYNSGLHLIYGRHHTLDLSYSQHPAVEGISGIVAHILVSKHRTAVIDAHWQIGLLLLEYLHQFDKMTSSFKVRCLYEIAVRQDIAAAQMHEMSTGCKSRSHCDNIIVSPGRE